MEKTVSEIISREVLNDVANEHAGIFSSPMWSPANKVTASNDLSTAKVFMTSLPPAVFFFSSIETASPLTTVPLCDPFAAMTSTVCGPSLSKSNSACHKSLTGVTLSASTIVGPLSTSSIKAIAEIDALFELYQR